MGDGELMALVDRRMNFESRIEHGLLRPHEIGNGDEQITVTARAGAWGFVMGCRQRFTLGKYHAHAVLAQAVQKLPQIMPSQHVLRDTGLASCFQLLPQLGRPAGPLRALMHSVIQQGLHTMMFAALIQIFCARCRRPTLPTAQARRAGPGKGIGQWWRLLCSVAFRVFCCQRGVSAHGFGVLSMPLLCLGCMLRAFVFPDSYAYRNSCSS